MSDPSDNQSLIERLRERKLVQWALGYLAGAWVLLEVFSTLQQGMGWPQALFPVLLALVSVGFVVTLVLAWYHGEQGHQRVSGPELLIITGLLVVSGIGFRILGGGDSSTEGELTEVAESPSAPDALIQPSVAVLPFVNMSGNPDNEYFSDGITEELLNALAQLPGVRVPGRTSSFAFKDQNITIRQIADTLDVAHVLEGSVRRDEDRVLITAQLVEAQTDTHLWSDTFERELEDIFAIQREIATAIADQLQVTLSAGQQQNLGTQATDSPEAHEAYLRGRHFLSQRTGESIRTAIPEFERAIELDPDYAEAYSGLADSYSLLDIYSVVLDRRVVRESGLEVALQAVNLAPDLGVTHTSLAMAYYKLGEWENAEQEYQRAIQLNPAYPTAHQWYGDLLAMSGRADEAIGVNERALELDPVSLIVNREFGLALWGAKRLDEAIEQWQRTTDLDPSWPRPWEDLTFALLDAGRYDDALDSYLTWARLSDADPVVAREFIEAVTRYKEKR